MKNILGLDLGSASIGWAYVRESDSESTPSLIVELGVRPVPLTTDESNNFTQGKAITTNADRTLARSARRNLQRYKQRRAHLIYTLREHGLISDSTLLAEVGKDTTYETLTLRAKAVHQEITLEELARVLLSINKKRGYRSSRKVNNTEDEGQIIDGMEVAQILFDRQITPGQYAYELLLDGKKKLPDFYRSDLINEFDRVWDKQHKHYPDLLTDEVRDELIGKPSKNTWAICNKHWAVKGIKIQGKRDEQKRTEYMWRTDALREEIGIEEFVIVLQAINRDISKSSGYLGAISDRSKELYFNKWTVGEYLLHSIENNRHTPLKRQVFYRQDYVDEFERIWETQRQFHPDILTAELKSKIKDNTIFYQRSLKSQKHLINLCEFEQKEITTYDAQGNPTGTRIVGLKVAPKSSPLFQEFKIWQVLGNLMLVPKSLQIQSEPMELTTEEKDTLFDELNIRGNMTATEVLKKLGCNPKQWGLNYTTIEGNRTNEALFNAYLRIAESEGYDRNMLLGIKSDKEDTGIKDAVLPAIEVKRQLRQVFQETIGIETSFMDFDATLKDKAFELQSSYQLWHLLYSYEGDDSPSGNEKLYELLQKKFGFKVEHAKILGAVSFVTDYGSLSTKAMRKIYPHLRTMTYDKACTEAEYKHSKRSITKEENEKRILKDSLSILPKNSLRQPVVEKVINQMINLVNALMEKYSTRDENGQIIEPFHFDEVRIELARELKQSAEEREKTTKGIAEGKKTNETVAKILREEFDIASPSHNDIIRYRLYMELKDVGFKEPYCNTYIPKERLFSPEVDIDHIIPQAVLYNDSFSNKTLTLRSTNQDKSNATALDYIKAKHYEDLGNYLGRVELLYKNGSISKAKYLNLTKSAQDLEAGFIKRDLIETQYITRLALELLEQVSRSVFATTGKITDKLREEWGLLNVMRELNFSKFKANDMTETIVRKNGQKIEIIKDWSKRNDHRHHAMDALTVAFTTRRHVQFFNTVNAQGDESTSIRDKVDATMRVQSSKRKLFEPPMPNFRDEAKKHLDGVIISHKAKNKAVTRHKNHIKGQKNPQQTLTPRGQLHKETVYGRRMKLMDTPTKLNKKFTLEQASLIADKDIRTVVLERVHRYHGDTTVAFDTKTMKKDPIILDGDPISEVTCYRIVYTKREDITEKLNLDTIVDQGVRRILQKRLDEYKGDSKKAFGDLTQNPIWLNKSEGITIKKVTTETTLKGVVPLHLKHDHLGNVIEDENNMPVPTDFVNLRNNHHSAIYIDEKGDVQEELVTLLEATTRATTGLPVVNRIHPEHPDRELLFTIKSNEMFVFPNETTGFDPKEIDLLNPKNKAIISPNLFRVQQISVGDYRFRHHLESTVTFDIKDLTFKRITSLKYFKEVVKVRVNHLGDIVQVGEY